MHVTSLLPAVVDMSSDDEAALLSDSNDDFSPILLPPGFQPASTPRRTTDDWTAHTLQMAHLWMVSGQDISVQHQPQMQGV